MSNAILIAGIGIGLLVLGIHWLGARGPAVPGTGAPDGAGAYSPVWPLDTINHYAAGVSLGLLALGVGIGPFVTVVSVSVLALLWEVYEAVAWNEVEGSGGLRRWFEDTQADILAVILGAHHAALVVL